MTCLDAKVIFPLALTVL